MIIAKDKRVFIGTGFTYMRKQINGFSAIAQVGLPEGPLSGSYFVFCGKTRKIMMILYWDNTGFCLRRQKSMMKNLPRNCWNSSRSRLG